MSEAAQYEKHSIWDWSLRLFHWSLAILVPMMWWTAENGNMALHRQLGLTLLGLLIYRLFWGIAGASTAKFSSFPIRPSQILAYLPKLKGGNYRPHPGHNPLASLSVIALLSVLAFQISTGLFAIDVDGLESGPLSLYVSFETGRDIADLHEASFNVLFGLIVLHLCAIAYYALALATDLISPMLTGRREVKVGDGDVDPKARANPALVVAGLVCAAAIVGGVLHFGA